MGLPTAEKAFYETLGLFWAEMPVAWPFILKTTFWYVGGLELISSLCGSEKAATDTVANIIIAEKTMIKRT